MSIEEIAGILFSGFVEGGVDGNFKAPFLNRKLQSWDKAKSYRHICGVLRDDVVLVDYDDPAAFECRLKIAEGLKQRCIAIRSPNRGGHFFWRNATRQVTKATTGTTTLLTLQPTDYKPAIKLKADGQIVPAKAAASLSKEDGTLREIVYCDVENGLDELPFYDAPLEGFSNSFLGMTEGDGRQEAIFNFMIPLKRAGLSYDQFLEVARLIDSYIFADSLAEEFENAVRREAWDNVNDFNPVEYFSAKGQFLHAKFGDFLIERHHVCNINNQPHIYQNGYYVPGAFGAIDKIALEYLPTLTKTKRAELCDYLRYVAPERQICAPRFICFRNGIFDLETGELTEHSPEIPMTNAIPWRYVPDAKSDMLDDFLNSVACGNDNIIALLEEIGGACLYRDNRPIRKAFLLVGDGSNGKSTFIDLLKAALDVENCSTLDFRDLDKRFQTAELYGKLANLGDDISDNFVENVSTFKKIVSGERITAEQKGRDPFSFEPYAKLIFAANTIPRFSDRSGAALNRLIMIPFDAQFREGRPEYDPQYRAKLTCPEVVEAYLSRAIQGIQRLLKVGKFTNSKEAEQLKDEFKIENNPVLAFIEECKNDAGEIEGIYREPTETVYLRYSVFCSRGGLRPLSKNVFVKQVNKELGITVKNMRINEKVFRVFTEP